MMTEDAQAMVEPVTEELAQAAAPCPDPFAPPVPDSRSADPAMLAKSAVPIPPVVDIHDIDWAAAVARVDAPAIRARMRDTVAALEALLDRSGGAGLLFDSDRRYPGDQTIRVRPLDNAAPLWIIGDLHGDLLALEAALAAIAAEPGTTPPNIVFLGDFFDDEGFGLEVLLRLYELILAAPERICVIVGNHDEALSYDGTRFATSVSPGDFADFLNANLAHEWIERAGKLALRLFAQAPRAVFLSDGLLAVHAGFPLGDLHARLEETGDWNDPTCLSDFAWSRAHPRARRKMPNRFTRGSQFGHEDFAAFCELSARLGRPVTHMVRGHDHVDDRYAIYPAYAAYPVLTTVALSRRLPREQLGPLERVPTIARYIEGSLPQVHRLHIPAELIHAIYPEPQVEGEPAERCEPT